MQYKGFPKTAPAAKVEASAPKRGSHSLSEAQTAAKQPPKRDGQAPHKRPVSREPRQGTSLVEVPKGRKDGKVHWTQIRIDK